MSFRTPLVLVLALFLIGCAGQKPFAPQAIDDIPEGPGLISGDDGEFTIYRRR